MKIPFNQNLIRLANQLTAPLYAVGGYVRNFLIDQSISSDVDLCSSVDRDCLCRALEKTGFKIIAEYPRTRTVLFTDGNQKYEFTAMRIDGYTGGGHKPIVTEYTSDINQDALRRDFKCNAVYYDIKNQKIIDPLNGVEDIKNKVLDTVKDPDQVFKNDGLRLMRLARFCGELGFAPTKQVLQSANKYADNILEIAPERIAEELKRILSSDARYSFSDKKGHYTALKVLDTTRVLDRIIPELTLGRNINQRKDYHKYDVLEHTLKAVEYAHPTVRLSALMHDVAKPKLFLEQGNFYGHDVAGEQLAKTVLRRLKFDNETIDSIAKLTRWHMIDMDLKLRQNKLRKFIVDNYFMLDQLLKLKQADFSASLDNFEVCPTVQKWQQEIKTMKAEKVPFTPKDLLVTAKDVMDAGFKGKEIGKVLSELFYQVVYNPKLNEKERLLRKINSYRTKI